MLYIAHFVLPSLLHFYVLLHDLAGFVAFRWAVAYPRPRRHVYMIDPTSLRASKKANAWFLHSGVRECSKCSSKVEFLGRIVVHCSFVVCHSAAGCSMILRVLLQLLWHPQVMYTLRACIDAPTLLPFAFEPSPDPILEFFTGSSPLQHRVDAHQCLHGYRSCPTKRCNAPPFCTLQLGIMNADVLCCLPSLELSPPFSYVFCPKSLLHRRRRQRTVALLL